MPESIYGNQIRLPPRVPPDPDGCHADAVSQTSNNPNRSLFKPQPKSFKACTPNTPHNLVSILKSLVVFTLHSLPLPPCFLEPKTRLRKPRAPSAKLPPKLPSSLFPHVKEHTLTLLLRLHISGRNALPCVTVVA
jgi:hypothetical protein